MNTSTRVRVGMNVSNSTGLDTDYKVSSSGG